MESTLDWGLEWILAVQGAGGPVLKTLFEIITFTGEEIFYLIFAPILFWAVDHRVGARVGFAFLISAYVNPVLKEQFPQSRPYEIDPSLSDRTVPGSGMPSGHAQSSVLVWGTLAAQIGRGWFWGLAVVFMVLVGLSRVYLGVHFPHQVAAGWMAGAVLLALYLFFDPRFESWMGKLSFTWQLAVAVVVPVLLALAYPHNDTIASAAVMCGFGSGYVLMRRYLPFSSSGLWWQRLSRALIGLAGLVAIYVGLSVMAPPEEAISASLFYLLRFLRYGVLGLWISLGAPWVFSLLPPLRTQTADLQAKHALS
jgi:membrane-associated phospholipid phosphatase